MHFHPFRLARAVVCVLAGVGCLSATAQSVPWQSTWVQSFAPAADEMGYASNTAQNQSPIVFSADGEVLVRTPSQSYLDDQIVRFDASGNVRWRVNLGVLKSSNDRSYGAMLASSDGGAYVALSNGSGLAAIDASGNVRWTSNADVTALALDGDRLIVQGCATLQVFDAASGDLSWSRHAPTTLPICDAGGVAVDASGAIYAGFGSYTITGPSIGDSVLVKFAADGSVLWQNHHVPIQVAGVGAGLVYVAAALEPYASDGTAAVRASDGTLAWQSSGPKALGVAGSNGDAIAANGNSVQRLAAEDGSVRWTVQSAYIAPQLLYLAPDGSKAIVDDMQVDLDSGMVDWTAQLPQSDGSVAVNEVASGRLANGNIAFGFVPSTFSIAPPVLRQFDATTGTAVAALNVPAGPQGLPGTTLAAGAQTLVDVAELHSGTDYVFGLRALDTDTGTVRWETKALPQPVERVAPSYRAASIAGDAVVLMDNFNNTRYPQIGPGGVWLGAFDLADGSARWSVLLEQEDDQRWQTSTAANDPVADADGNVIVAFAAHYWLQRPWNGYNYAYILSVVKLAAADGSVLWRHEETFGEFQLGFDAYAPNVSTVGNDVYIGGPFASPYTQDSLLKLSGSDGSVTWATDIFPNIFSVRGASDGNVVVTDADGWAELDAQTGAVQWSNPLTYPCNGFCVNGGGEAVLPNGDAWYAGQNDSRARLVRRAVSAGAAAETIALDADDTALFRSYADTPFGAADGTLWTRITRNYAHAQRAVYLAQFDPVTHALLRQQALYLRGRSALLDYDLTWPLAAPENERMPVHISAYAPPQQPATLGSAVLDTTVRATGNLALQFTVDKSAAASGKPVDFRLHVDYSGDAPIAGARLLADFPWVGRASGVACSTQAAANCVLDERAETLFVTFDVQPGGSVDITGRILTSDGVDAGQLSAIVIGPLGLNERDTSDNVSQTIVNQSLFADGFE